MKLHYRMSSIGIRLALGLLVASATISTSPTLDARGGPPGGGPPGGGGGPPGGGGSGAVQIGVPGSKTPERYHLSSLNRPGNIEVIGPVVMVVDGDISLGNDTLTITGDGSLELYFGGNISVGGKPGSGFNNSNVPSKLLVFGTHPDTGDSSSPNYSVSLNGNGAFTGVLYAPEVEYVKNGGGGFGYSQGSVVAKDVRFNGSPGPFHYDEALEEISGPFGGYSLTKYELKHAGDLSPSDSARLVVGDTDYESLFDSLFGKP